jgi:hypothetical protein
VILARSITKAASFLCLEKPVEINQTPDFNERHDTVDPVAELWNLSRESVRKMFLSEPDVPNQRSRARVSHRAIHV